MKDYNKLKQVIQDANPEIMELKFGCELMDKTEPKDWAKFVTLVCYDNHNGRIYLKEPDGSVYHERTSSLSNYEILGRPIRLANVLLAIGYKFNSQMGFDSDQFVWKMFVDKNGKEIEWREDGETKLYRWNLKDDNLDHQSDETKALLINLLV